VKAIRSEVAQMRERREKIRAALERTRGWLDRNTPPGFPWGTTLKAVTCAEVLGFLWSLSFFAAYAESYGWLFRTVYGGKKILIEDAVMTDFADLLSGRMLGFFAVAVAMIALAGYHYSYHFHGSKSIYVMKRLPHRSELVRRCAALPILIAAVTLAAVLLLTLIYYWFYMAVTPKHCLTPGQWAKLWSVGTAWRGGM